jgi:hypothetical protein
VKSRIFWVPSVLELFLELPDSERESIEERLELIELFPRMYPVRSHGSRFRRHRWFRGNDWLVYYRVVDNDVFIRGMWPARIP